MRSTALAYKDEDDEVPVSSQEVLEANVAAIRVDLNELKTDFRAAVTRIDNDIKNAVSKLEGEIRSMAAKAENDLRGFAARMESQLADMRQDMREMRAEDKALRDRIDKNHETTNAKISDLNHKVDRIGTKLSLLLWLFGGLGTTIPIGITVGKAFKWF
jgi:ElaB/YqjD/DUF883 family membrane-anchored ribosome-binding protein